MIFSWIPIVGPIIDGIVSIFNKKEDTTVSLSKIATGGDVSVIQSRAAVAIAFKDDIGVNIIRDLLMFPTAVWYALIVWDSTMKNLVPTWTWDVVDLPQSVQYIPYAAVAFLFVTSWKK